MSLLILASGSIIVSQAAYLECNMLMYASMAVLFSRLLLVLVNYDVLAPVMIELSSLPSFPLTIPLKESRSIKIYASLRHSEISTIAKCMAKSFCGYALFFALFQPAQ